MIGSSITKALVMVLGYAYTAYECYKVVEKNKPEIEQLRFWCQYWILVAVLVVCERIGDAFISWVPMYSEAKLLFFIFLWCPKTKGTIYLYNSFFRQYVAKHEPEIDRSLLELRTRPEILQFCIGEELRFMAKLEQMTFCNFLLHNQRHHLAPLSDQHRVGGSVDLHLLIANQRLQHKHKMRNLLLLPLAYLQLSSRRKYRKSWLLQRCLKQLL